MYEYSLLNGAKIDADRTVDAVLGEEDYPQVYLDTELGALVEVSSADNLRRWVEEIGTTKRYLIIERFTDADRDEFARYFVKTLLADMEPSAVTGAEGSLAQGGWRAMTAFLEKSTDGWIHGWDQYLADEAWESVHEWLTNNPYVAIKAEFEGCGNCAMCELIRKGEGGNGAKLMKAFETERIMRNVEQQMAGRAKSSTWVDEVFVFKITLNESKPRIWRRIEVPTSYTFFELHCAIQNAMGWSDGHLHAFRVDTRGQSKAKRRDARGEFITIEFPDPERSDRRASSDWRDERTERVADWFGPRITQCTHEYDFGDSWTHTVLLEKKILREPDTTYPRCAAGKNACPPEDCGGVGGYDDLQKIMKDPKHEEHAEMLEWLGIESADKFDPSYFDAREVEFEDPAERLKEYEEGFGVN